MDFSALVHFVYIIVWSTDFISKSFAEEIHRVSKSGTVNLLCNVSSGTGDSLVKWFKNGRDVEETSRRIIKSENTLMIINIQTEDSGTYVCSVNSKPGQAHHVTVKYSPELRILPFNLTLREGTTMKLSCAVDAYPQPTHVTWKRFSDEIKRTVVNKKTLQTSTAQLTIEMVKPGDAGFYFCEAKNEEGTGQSLKSHVSVKYVPRVAVSVKNSQVELNSYVQLRCSISAFPDVTEVNWLKVTDSNTKKLDLTGRFVNTRGTFSNVSTLLIVNITTDDAGDYQCVAINVEGRGKSDVAHVDVIYGPRDISVSPASPVLIYVGCVVFALCSCDGNPAPVFTWFKAGANVSSGAVLKLLDVALTDTGKYQCLAHNVKGNKMVDLEVVVQNSPMVKKNSLTLQSYNLMSATLKCSVQSEKSSGRVVWMLGDKTLPEEGDTLNISFSSPNSSFGMYTCRSHDRQALHKTEPYTKTAASGKKLTPETVGVSAFLAVLIAVVIVSSVYRYMSGEEDHIPHKKLESTSDTRVQEPIHIRLSSEKGFFW